tara:strand:+ start:259 stop:405 length:147 start_codon:yes stop_codon:yes gene_type:complete
MRQDQSQSMNLAELLAIVVPYFRTILEKYMVKIVSETSLDVTKKYELG